jgi:hypothetical protein
MEAIYSNELWGTYIAAGASKEVIDTFNRYRSDIEGELSERAEGDIDCDCAVATYFWAKAFEREGLEVSIVLGDYAGSDDNHHVWLEVPGERGKVIFDPTAGQFDYARQEESFLPDQISYGAREGQVFESAEAYAQANPVNAYLGPIFDGEEPRAMRFFHDRSLASAELGELSSLGTPKISETEATHSLDRE